MAISKNITNVFQIYKDEAKKHVPLPPVFLPDYTFAFDDEVDIVEGIFVERTTSNIEELDIYSDGTSFTLSDMYQEHLLFKEVPYVFNVFGFEPVIIQEPIP